MNAPAIISEDVLLAICFQWAWNTYPQTRRLLLHIPNELDRLPGESRQNHIRRLTQAKAKGVVPGAPDLIFLWDGVLYAFELKTPIGSVSAAQTTLHSAWQAQRCTVMIIRSLVAFQTAFNSIIRV